MTDVSSFSNSYESVEEFCQSITALGWNAEVRQLEKGAGINSVALAWSERAVLMKFDFERRNHQLSEPPNDFVTFGLPAQRQAPGRVANRVLESESILNIDPLHGMDAVVEGGFQGFTLSFPEQRIAELAELCEVPYAGDQACRGTERLPGDLLVASLRHRAQRVLDLVLAGSSSPTLLRQLESDLPMALVQAWGISEASPARRSHNRYRVLRRALEYLEAHPEEPHGVEALCKACATSVSTLERAFREHFSVSPKTYLTQFRLAGLRRALVAAQSGDSVTQCANDWGFWHMGKLAADYRAAFQELPSVTLGRARSNATAMPRAS